MKKEFNNPEIEELISNKLNLNKDFIDKYFDIFNKFFPDRITLEYLSHIRCALEFHVRKYTDNKLFTITLKPSSKNSSNDCISKIIIIEPEDPASSLIITYPSGNDEYTYKANEIRMAIAHELAHAFFLINHVELKKELEAKNKFEDVSSLLAIMLMHDRSYFYKNKAKDFTPKLEDIIKDMSQLHNKKDGKFNIS